MSFKVKLLRKLTKRPYGLAKFKVGRTLYSKVVRFDKDSTEWMGGKYVFDKGLIHIEKSGNKKTFNGQSFETWEEGYPIIYFDAKSAVPTAFISEKDQRLPTAKAIQQTIKKEIATFEAEMMRKTRSKLMLGIMIVLIISLVAIGVSAMGYLEAGKVGQLVAERCIPPAGVG
jgi:hypothetical protein